MSEVVFGGRPVIWNVFVSDRIAPNPLMLAVAINASFPVLISDALGVVDPLGSTTKNPFPFSLIEVESVTEFVRIPVTFSDEITEGIVSPVPVLVISPVYLG